MRDFLKNPFKSRRKRNILDPSSPDFGKSLEAKKPEQKKKSPKEPKTGALASGSILDELPEEEEEGIIREPYNMAAALNPRPHDQARWERKMVIREIRRRGRISKTGKLARTERSHLSKSELIKTSIKKLFPLANQIRGKPLTEAMVQMRFSKKKAAQDVLKHLEYARDQAIVMRGMGLGKVRARREAEEAEEAEAEESGDEQEAEERQEAKQREERLVVEDKRGKKRVVTDWTAMYVDEAWVGRGPYGMGIDYRARGQGHQLRLPYTSEFLSFEPALVIGCLGSHGV